MAQLCGYNSDIEKSIVFLKIKECDEAIDIIQNLFDENLKPESEEIPVTEAYGRILFEDVYSRMDFPPFYKALKDGFAILAEDNAQQDYDSETHLDFEDDVLPF